MNKNNNPYMRRVCARIRQRAADRGLSALTLAKTSGVSYRIVHNAMHGTANLRHVTIGRFAKALDTTYAVLTGESASADGQPPNAPPAREVREKRAAYPTPTEPTLRQAIQVMARQLGVTEEAVIERVVAVLQRQQQASGSP